SQPIWTRDGQRVLFRSERDGETSVWWQRAEGGAAERFAKVEQGVRPQPESWTPDGKLLFSVRGRGNDGASVSMLSLNADQNATMVIKPPASNPSLSPDGRWMAYHTIGSTTAVFVEPFPPTGEKHQIAGDGGTQPLWSPDGKELFYLSGFGQTDRQIMAVDIRTQHGFVSGKARPLPIQGLVSTGPRPYDITPDGKYFVVMMPKSQVDLDRSSLEQINITLDWFSELRQRVPVK